MAGVMHGGTQAADGAARREEAHHQATPGSHVDVQLRSSEEFLPCKSQCQSTPEAPPSRLPWVTQKEAPSGRPTRGRKGFFQGGQLSNDGSG